MITKLKFAGSKPHTFLNHSGSLIDVQGSRRSGIIALASYVNNFKPYSTDRQRLVPTF
jgi:hypothetical protein